jgi:predicted flap endonuclease-1-like 5' DNA nuclease
MTKSSNTNYNPYKAENPFLAMSVIGLQTTSVMTEMWLGAVRGMMAATQEKSAEAKEAESAPTSTPAATPVAAEKVSVSDQADDLKKITGVGPKLEQILNKQGISTYAQIAGMSAKEMAKIGESLGFPGRIERDDWAGQAKALMEAKK